MTDPRIIDALQFAATELTAQKCRACRPRVLTLPRGRVLVLKALVDHAVSGADPAARDMALRTAQREISEWVKEGR